MRKGLNKKEKETLVLQRKLQNISIHTYSPLMQGVENGSSPSAHSASHSSSSGDERGSAGQQSLECESVFRGGGLPHPARLKKILFCFPL